MTSRSRVCIRLFVLLCFSQIAVAQNISRLTSGVKPLTVSPYPVTCDDAVKLLTINSATPFTITLPSVSTCGAGYVFQLKNLGPGLVTIAPVAGTIDNMPSQLLVVGSDIEIYDNGSNYSTLGSLGTVPSWIITPSLKLTNSGFLGTFDFPLPLTANRNILIQDVSGYLPLTANPGPVAQPNFPHTWITDQAFCGPNPYIDVRCYGVRMVSAVPSTTVTISSGSRTATLASNGGFQNGDGFVAYGAGANNPVATPAAPTVVTSLSKGSLRVGNVVAANAGSTTYKYQVACRDKAGALTAASRVGTTTTGLANLGAVSVNISSLTRTNNSVAVVTSSANDLVVGSAVYIQGTNDSSFNGPHLVATVTNNTHFTYTQAISTTLGATSSATGGTATWYTSNHITFALPTDAWKCGVWGRTSGRLTFLGFSKPLETYFDDYGSTAVFNGESIMGTPYTPSYIPSTPPVSATNDPLVTTIVAGGGTTTLTLANAAVNSVSGATALFDDGITLKAAVTASGSEPVYIPNSGGSLVVNSYTILPGPATIWQAAPVVLDETLEMGGSSTWVGDMGGAGATTLQFSWNQSRPIATNAQPGIYLPNPGDRFRSLAFSSNFDQALNVLTEGNFEQATFDYCQFQTGTGGLQFDALGIGYEERGAVNTTFNFTLLNSNFNNSIGPLGLWAPSILHTASLNPVNGPGGYMNLRKTMISPKGITQDLGFAQTSVNAGSIEHVYAQGARTPIVTFSQAFQGGLGSNWKITDIENDTTFAPVVANLGTALGTIEISNLGSNTGPLLSGNPVTNLVTNTPSVGPYLGAKGTNVFNDARMTVLGPGTFQSGMFINTTAPGLVVGVGGTLSVGAHTYKVQFMDINGNGSASTFTATASTTTGNQTIVVTPTAFPSGAFSWIIIRDGAPLQFPVCSQLPIPVSTTSFRDTGFSTCGSLNLTPGAGTSILGQSGISTPSLVLINNGFTSSTNFPKPLTANRTVAIADGANAYVVSASLTTTSANSDNVKVQGATASSHCGLTATNASAAADSAGTFISNVKTNQVTVTHPTNSGRTWNILCTPN